MSARAAFLTTSFLGTFWATYGLFRDLTDVGIGLAVASVGVLGYEFLRWER